MPKTYLLDYYIVKDRKIRLWCRLYSIRKEGLIFIRMRQALFMSVPAVFN